MIKTSRKHDGIIYALAWAILVTDTYIITLFDLLYKLLVALIRVQHLFLAYIKQDLTKNHGLETKANLLTLQLRSPSVAVVIFNLDFWIIKFKLENVQFHNI